MLESLTSLSGSISLEQVFVYSIVSIILGFIIAVAFMKTGEYSTNFVITLVLLPILVQTVIIMVNGNIGTGVAVAGAFSLVRFRSIPGSSREISAIFFAMAVGLATGIGELFYATTITLLISVALVILSKSNFGKNKTSDKALRVTIPENLDYNGIFDDLFTKYTKKAELERAKTTNMGSMFELNYTIQLKADVSEKEMMDEIRCRNGNLTVVCGKASRVNAEL